MFLRKITKKSKDRTYVYYGLVRSVHTGRGPRQKVVCSLGTLEPRPESEWLKWARRIEAVLSRHATLPNASWIGVYPDRATVERVRPAGPLHAALDFWNQLGIDRLIAALGLPSETAAAARTLAVHRLFCPDPAQPVRLWAATTALADLTGNGSHTLRDSVLYSRLEPLLEKQEEFEKGLAGIERTILDADPSVELGCLLVHPLRRSGERIGVALVVNPDGFPVAHSTWVNGGNAAPGIAMLEQFDAGAPLPVFVRPAEAFAKEWRNLCAAGFAPARVLSWEDCAAAESADAGEWTDVRQPPSSAPLRHGYRVRARHAGGRTDILLLDPASRLPDFLARLELRSRFAQELDSLQRAVAEAADGGLPDTEAALGSLNRRYAAISRCFDVSFDRRTRQLRWSLREHRWSELARWDGARLFEVERLVPLNPESLWRTGSACCHAMALLDAIRGWIEPPRSAPLRCGIFASVLAFHLRRGLERRLGDWRGGGRWDLAMQALSSHHIATIALPADKGGVLHMRIASRPEPRHLRVYGLLGVSPALPLRQAARAVTPSAAGDAG